MPVVFTVAIKPTPSIAIKQRTVNVADLRSDGYARNTEIEVNGRHDPCIVQRAVSVIESAAAIAMLDMLYGM